MNPSATIYTIRLSGELEIARKNEIREALHLSQRVPAVLLDLAEVTYADSIALTELLRFCVNAQREKLPVALVIKAPQFARLVQYAGLASAFKIFEEHEPAVEYLEERARQ